MRDIAIAFDTSNYTTSCAVFDGAEGFNSGRLLDVAQGQLGLRQSDALFSHVKRLPEIVESMDIDGRIIAVGASTKPREAEDSYMPCFLAGASQARVISEILKVPMFEFSHQQGHIAAALWSAGREELMAVPHLSWHLSGGTTELLYVTPYKSAVRCEVIGGTSDLAAGQLIDRAGQLLGLPFPSGKELDRLAEGSECGPLYSPKVSGLSFSLSGVEHKMKQLFSEGETPENLAYFTIASIISAVRRVTDAARDKYGDVPIVYSGGVAANSLLRKMTPEGIFAEPKYSTDNAMGVAILTYRAVKDHG